MSSLLIGLVAALVALPALYMTGILQKALRFIYGDFTSNEVKKFVSYGFLFFIIIGTYWLLRCAKDPIFNAFVGAESIWLAKIVSLLVIFPIVAGYSYLVDMFPRHRLFYAIAAIYIVLFVGIAFLMGSSVYGMGAPAANRWGLLGWFSYVMIESFGSLVVVLFYSFMADTTTPEAGKKAFFITATFGQVGAILGSYATGVIARSLSVPQVLFAAAAAVALIPPMVAFIMWFIPKGEFAGYQAKGGEAKKTKPGFVEGFKLFLSEPYLLGIFIWVSAFEVIATVFDLQFKVLIMREVGDNAAEFARWTSDFGVTVATLALISLLLGVGNIGRRLGLTLSLVILPILMAANAFVMFVSPVVQVAFWVMVASKGINYAFGQPSKEQLFIPTSREARYKSKAWVDSFGSRGSKAMGSLIKGFAGGSAALLLGTAIGISAIWVVASLYLGKKATQAVANNEVVC